MLWPVEIQFIFDKTMTVVNSHNFTLILKIKISKRLLNSFVNLLNHNGTSVIELTLKYNMVLLSFSIIDYEVSISFLVSYDLAVSLQCDFFFITDTKS